MREMREREREREKDMEIMDKQEHEQIVMWQLKWFRNESISPILILNLIDRQLKGKGASSHNQN